MEPLTKDKTVVKDLLSEGSINVRFGSLSNVYRDSQKEISNFNNNLQNMLTVGGIAKEEAIGEITKEEEVEFCWGEKKDSSNKNVQFYKSFKYDGVTYSLFDCVYVWCGDEPEPSIGKILKMWETPTHEKKVKYVWFFRPCEISNFLGDVKLLEKEIFLACGEGTGLSRIGSPEAVAGKCEVICMSSDKRNAQVSNEELRSANHIFYRTFHVERCKISERFPDKIADTEVVHYFNKENDRNLRRPETEKKKPLIVRLQGVVPPVGISIKEEPKIEEGNLLKRRCSGVDSTTDPLPMKKRKVHFNLDPVVEKIEQSKGWSGEKFSDTYTAAEEHGKGSRTCNNPFTVTRKPDEESNKWFREQPWEIKMQRAHETDALVLLENLDPSYTSSEIEDIVWNALHRKVDAKMIHCSIPSSSIPSSSHNGKAFVIFKSREAAESAICELTRKCLVLTDGSDHRPVIARYLKNLREKTKFPGHLIIDRRRYQKQYHDMGRASTSHYSQPNNLEHELALEWCALQEKWTLSWNALYEQQDKERDEIQSKLKIPREEQDLHKEDVIT